MSNTINGRTPEEIKKGLECCCGMHDHSYCRECPYSGDDCDEMSRDALAYVQQLEAAQPKWISVEERLPEAKTAVLAYGQRHVFNGKEIEGFPMAHVAYTRGWEEGWFSWDSDHYIDVTHWLPLPPAPNDNKEE